MKKLAFKTIITLCLIQSLNAFSQTSPILLKGAKVIDGNGGAVVQKDILISGGKIIEIGANLSHAEATTVDVKGKTIMPAMVSAHVHVGVIKGNSGSGTFFTRENILAQLNKYQDFGITNILTMGSDRPILFNGGIRDSSVAGLFPGARFHSAGYGFNVPDASVTPESFLGNLYRPASVAEVPGMVSQLVKLKPALVKIWVDGSPANKMKPEVYQTIIEEAHKHNLRVAAHVYYLADARRLVASGIDIFGHSIRDSVIDDALISQLKAKNIPYIPTLTLDKFASAYSGRPDWMNDEYFKRALEPGVYEMLDSEKYRSEQQSSAANARSAGAHEIALKNVKKLHDAGVLVALGTDSGAFPIRPQGFAEHLELELLVKAGLTPLQAITLATKNAAKVMRIDQDFGTIEKGKVADLIVLDNDPSEDIKNTRTIAVIYKAGLAVSKGPVTD